MSESLYNQLKQGLWYRNHLTHHFFYEHSDDFITEAGRKVMIIKLQEMMNLLKQIIILKHTHCRCGRNMGLHKA